MNTPEPNSGPNPTGNQPAHESLTEPDNAGNEVALSAALAIKLNGFYERFAVEDWGINREQFIAELAPTFENLPWDYYDVRKAHIKIIEQELPELSELYASELRQYYVGTRSLDSIASRLGDMLALVQPQIQSCQPFRQRSVANFVAGYTEKSGWSIERIVSTSVAQDVERDDIRSIPRVFTQTEAGIIESPMFQKLLYAVLEKTREADPRVQEVTVTTWHNRLVTRDVETTNSPEGIHQDGANFIVSALVVDRHNITGGCSQVYGADKETKLLNHELQAGEGIFQSDQDSPLWHDVTPVRIDDPAKGIGWRSTIGFDIKFVPPADN